MTNKEKYREEIENYVMSNIVWGVDKLGKIIPCRSCDMCDGCRFYSDTEYCKNTKFNWLNQEYSEIPQLSSIDWSKVPVDTPILVSNNQFGYKKRYFCKYENGKVYAFDNGSTSWSSDDNITYWDYAKLADESEAQ